MSDKEELSIIQSEFERFYDLCHSVRNNVEKLDSIDEMWLIK